MSVQELTTIRGFVQALPPAGGREDAARVAVITEDGTAYHVLHKGAGAELASDINANVEVTGFLARQTPAVAEDAPADGHDDDDAALFLLTVKSYRLIDGFDDPWYDDDV